MSEGSNSSLAVHDIELTDATDGVAYEQNLVEIYPSLTMPPNDKLTTTGYGDHQGFTESEMGEMVKSVTWNDVFSVLNDGRYWTAKAIADQLNARTASVQAVLEQNRSKVHSPSHQSHRSGDVFYVLSNRRKRVYEALRPIQLAFRGMN